MHLSPLTIPTLQASSAPRMTRQKETLQEPKEYFTGTPQGLTLQELTLLEQNLRTGTQWHRCQAVLNF